MNKVLNLTEAAAPKEVKKVKMKYGIYDFVRFTLITCLWTGLLPISGLMQNNSEKLRFTLKSSYIAICLASLGLQTFEIVFRIYDITVFNFDVYQFTKLFQKIMSYTFMICLACFCRKLPKMLRKIEDIERHLPPLANARKSIIRIHIVTVAILIFSFVEQLICIISSIEMTKICGLHGNNESEYNFRTFFISDYTWLSYHISVDYVLGFFLRIATLQNASMHSYIDLIIISFSLYLLHRFQDFNEIMQKYQNNVSQKKFAKLPWLDLNIYYTRLSRLVKIVNKHISIFVLFSFTSNYFFIGEQLFYIINPIPTSSNTEGSLTYEKCMKEHSKDKLSLPHFYVSVSLALLRTVFVSAIPARVYTLSLRPLLALHIVPATAYNDDLQRFMDQVYYSNNSLNGLGLFNVTRKMILTVTATLITYELVLLQF